MLVPDGVVLRVDKTITVVNGPFTLARRITRVCVSSAFRSLTDASDRTHCPSSRDRRCRRLESTHKSEVA